MAEEQQLSDVVARFMRYVQIPSASDEAHADVTPSTPEQNRMAEVLSHDLEELGCTGVEVSPHAYVTATYPATEGLEGLPALGLCAHIDTSPDAPGEGVHPHIVRYDGGALVAGTVGDQPVETTVEQVPALADLVGQDIVCSDGTTLLGADDKAGVAEICSLLQRLGAHPEIEYPTLKIAFVPDEEIGHGASLLDLGRFGAAWCYTVDGGEIGEFSYETFNASEATVEIQGVMVHPGSAKDVMVNAIAVAAEFDRMLPAFERPEHTEGYEGFYHPVEIEGTASAVKLVYIVRDHDAKKQARREETLRDVAAFLDRRYGEGTVKVSIREQYRNMAEGFEGLDFLVENALEANRRAGIEPHVIAVRGGTDGSQLTLRGLPCPNLATGGFNAHSVREFVPVRSLEATVDVLQHLVELYAVPQSA